MTIKVLFALFVAFLYLQFNYHEIHTLIPPQSSLLPEIEKNVKFAPKKELLGLYQKEKLVETYLDSSGLWSQLGLPEKILGKHLDNPKMLTRLSVDDLKKIKILIQEKLGVDAISKKVKLQILNSFSAIELTELIKIYSSPIMKKVASLEEYLTSEDLLVKANLVQLQTDKGSYRAQLLRKLEKVKNEGERGFLITLHSIKGLHKGFNQILPKEKRISDDKIKNTLSILKKYARPKFKNLALIRYDFAYQELSNAELQAYISIGSNKLLQRAQESTLKGIIEAFEAL